MRIQTHNQLVIAEDYISRNEIEQLLSYTKSTEEYGKVSSGTNPSPFQGINITKRIQQALIPENIKTIFEKMNSNFIKITESIKYPQVVPHINTISISNNPMAYHADGEEPIDFQDRDLGMPNEQDDSGYRAPKNQEWKTNKTAVRVFTSIVYLHDDFFGGETTFPTKKIDVKPSPGKLIAFPCSRDYVHGVRPVRNGPRIVIPTWYQMDTEAANRFFQQRDWH